MAKNTPSFSFEVLGIRDFRLLVLTRMLFAMGLQAQAIIVGWQIYAITGNPFLLGLTGLVEAIPAVGGALIAGHVVDTYQPLKILRIATAALFLNTFVLMLCGGGHITLSSTALLAVMYCGVFISGAARSYLAPSAFSLRAEIVPRQRMSSATAWWSSGYQAGAIAGPPIAGLIYGGYGVSVAWLFPAIVLAAALVMAMALHVKPLTRAAEKRLAAMQSIREGWQFILKNQVMLAVMSLDMFAVLFGGAVAMLPAFAKEILNVGSEGLGLMRAAPAVGAVVVALYLAVRPMKRIRATTLLWVVAAFGLCMIGFGLSHVFWLSMAFLLVSGAVDSVSMVIRGTIMQLLTPDNMQGRVSSVNSMFIFSSNEIGAFESGTAAKLLGLVPSVVAGGSITVLLSGLTAWLSPKLRATVVLEDGTIDTTGKLAK